MFPLINSFAKIWIMVGGCIATFDAFLSLRTYGFRIASSFILSVIFLLVRWILISLLFPVYIYLAIKTKMGTHFPK